MKKIFCSLLFVVVILSFICTNSIYRKAGTYFIVNMYKNKKMRAYIKGNGKALILLSGWATENPIDDFKPLIDELSYDFKVVALEYFGYGKSDIVETDRSNKTMVEEIRTALVKLNIKPPYILMPHSMSGLYCLYYANQYPNEVYAIVGLDMSLPQKQLERWTEKTFEKTKINAKSDELNISIANQWNFFYANSHELKNIKYDVKLPVLMFLASEQINSVNEMIKSGEMKTRWKTMNQNMITNHKLQTIQILQGGHYIYQNQCKQICQLTKQFLNNIDNMGKCMSAD